MIFMRKLLQLLIVLVVLNALALGGLWYGFSLMQDKKAAEAKLRGDIADEQQKWKKVAVLRRTLVLAENDRAAYAKYFYDSSEESQIKFISEIEHLGTTTGAMVKTEAFEYSAQDPKSFRATFSMSGSWGQLYHMLRLVEEYPGRMVIDRFDAREIPLDTDHKSPYWSGAIAVELMSIRASQ